MYKILLIFLLLPFAIKAQSLEVGNPLRMLALGDSYTIGQSVPPQARWPIQLRDSLSVRGIDVDTVRIIATTGWCTDNLISAISGKHLADLDYNLVSVLIGVNNQYQGRPFIQYASEFPALLDSAVRYAGGQRDRVFVLSIPDYAFTPFGQQSDDPAQISIALDQYNAYSRSVADSMHITYFDITPISRLGLQQPSLVASDGLHPSGLQYTEWVRLMLAYIDEQSTSFGSVHADRYPDIKVMPNPTSGNFVLEIPQSYLHLSPCTLRVYDQAGNKLLEELISKESTSLSLAGLPDGCYLVNISIGRETIIRKIIKQGSVE